MLFALILACADPGAGKTHATVEAPPTPVAAAPTTPPPPAQAGKILKPSGQIGFTGAKITKSHDGTFESWTGEMSVEGEVLQSVKFEVQVSSLNTQEEKLNNHLRSPDFFDVAQFPQATFVSTAIKAGPPADNKLANATHTIEGDLIMHGVSKHLSFPAVIGFSPTEVSAKTEFVINRKDFGIVYPGKPDDLIKDDVVIRADFKAAR